MIASSVVPALQLSFRAAVAAGLAFGLAQLLELKFPLYAMIAAVIVTDLEPSESRKLGWRRLAGTVIGTVLGAVLSIALPPGAFTIGLGIFLTMALSHLLRLPEAARIAGYLSAIVLLEHTAEPWVYAFWRFAETVLGIVIALIVSLTPKLLRAGEPR
jgi:uncharacterized membrane protein YgaE (UPF0421/DUF939 family)